MKIELGSQNQLKFCVTSPNTVSDSGMNPSLKNIHKNLIAPSKNNCRPQQGHSIQKLWKLLVSKSSSKKFCTGGDKQEL